MNKDDCIFCKIIRKEIPSMIIFEDDKTLAFLDNNPISEGHSIIIPKNHFGTLEIIPNDEIASIFQTAKKIAKLIYEKLDIEGYNILQNNYKAAGQVIDHCHIHIIPRREGDGKIILDIPKNSTSNKSLNNVLEKFRS
ncbi:MAG: HIT family protein [Candidatus Lokiarchaeota archaeon]|nr:HIT family protein [Candidatus Lokiarchaeota archaeon]